MLPIHLGRASAKLPEIQMSTCTSTASFGHGNKSNPECQLRHGASQQRKKSRASHVCQGCRKRKVKCDLLVSGNTCSNCRKDEIACIPLESKRSRKHRLRKHHLGQDVSNFRASSQRTLHNGSQVPEIAPVSQVLLQPADEFSQPLDGTDFPVCISVSSQQPLLQTSMSVNLPSYVKSVRHGFDTDNMAFLASRGALTVPGDDIRDELIRSFVLYVHPYIPVFNLQDFFNSTDQMENCNPLSLLVLQAVLYSGCAFVDMSVLESLGFQTRIGARKAFYIKVKQLYEFDWEEDPIPVIQALLLITDWFESPDDQKDPWYWLGVCRMIANRVGLGNDRSCMTRVPKSRSLLKRLWWMCILRDRVIAVATRKPLQFEEQKITASLLTVDDFEIQPIHTKIASLRESAVLTDLDIRQTLARLCIEKINVSGWVTRILSQNYSPGSGSHIPTTSVMLHSPNAQIGNMAENIDLHRGLEHWRKTLPDNCVFAELPGNTWKSTEEEVLYLHRGVLRMFSLMVSGLLYRPLLSARMNPLADSYFPQHEIRLVVERVANETARMGQIFCQQGLVPKLPAYATTFFISALPTFLLGIKTSSGVLCNNLKMQFRWCSEGVAQQRSTWPTSELAYAMVEAMIAKAQVRDARGLMGGSSVCAFAGSLPPANQTLESEMMPCRKHGTDLRVDGPSGASLNGKNNENCTPAEGVVDWVSCLDFDDGLFSQLCNYSDSLPADWN